MRHLLSLLVVSAGFSACGQQHESRPMDTESGISLAQVCSTLRNILGDATKQNPLFLYATPGEIARKNDGVMERLSQKDGNFGLVCKEDLVKYSVHSESTWREAASEAELANAEIVSEETYTEMHYQKDDSGRIIEMFVFLDENGSVMGATKGLPVVEATGTSLTSHGENVLDECPSLDQDTMVPCLSNGSYTLRKIEAGVVEFEAAESRLIYIDEQEKPLRDENGDEITVTIPAFVLSSKQGNR